MGSPLPSFRRLGASSITGIAELGSENVGSAHFPSPLFQEAFSSTSGSLPHSLLPLNSCRVPVPLRILSDFEGIYHKITESNQGSLLLRNTHYWCFLLSVTRDTALSGPSPVGCDLRLSGRGRLMKFTFFLAWYWCYDRISSIVSGRGRFMKFTFFWHGNLCYDRIYFSGSLNNDIQTAALNCLDTRIITIKKCRVPASFRKVG